MRSIRNRVDRLEGRRQRAVPVLILRNELSPDERQPAVEEHRRTHGAVPDAPVIVITPEEARL